MRIDRRGASLATLALLLASVAGAPAQADPSHTPPPGTIELPNGWQPEGITTDGRSLFVGSLADGSIWRADPRTAAGEVLAEGADGRVAVGIDYDRRRDVLWVAGGGTGEIRAQDADTGEVLATYPVPDGASRFLNDLVVTPHAVYVTDSFHSELAVIPLGTGLPPSSAATLLPLAGDLALEDGFNLNGIVRSGRWLVAVQSNTGLLFRIDPRSGETTAIDLGGATVVNGDGLEPGHGRLYVVRNLDDLVVAVHLRHGRRAGTVEDEITSDGFDVPTTAALVHQSLYVVNARFTTPPTADTAYWITRVDAR